MLTGMPPWMGQNQLDLAGNLTKFELKLPSALEPVNPHLHHLLQLMLDKDPCERATLEAVMRHDWVTCEGAAPLLREVSTQESLDITDPVVP
jgi:serine/threonine protein kinase